jgi:membrane protease YdiL (CAAX protease family)
MKFDEKDPLSVVSLLPARGYIWRYVVAMILCGIGVAVLKGQDEFTPQQDIVLMVLSFGLMALVFHMYVLQRSGLAWRQSFGERVEDWRLLFLALPLFGIGIASIFLVFTPMAWLKPEWVNAWFEDSSFPPLGQGWFFDLLIVLSVVVLAPFIEELLYRFYLFRRWSEKWGVYWGGAASSILFAIGHSDILGALLFGLILCFVYWRTRSLWACVFIHGLNNAIVMLLVVMMGEDQRSMALIMQEDWWQGVLAACLSIPLFILFWRRVLLQKRPAARSGLDASLQEAG